MDANTTTASDIQGLIAIPPEWTDSYFEDQFAGVINADDAISYFRDLNTYKADLAHNQLVTEQAQIQNNLSQASSALNQKAALLGQAQAKYEAENALQNPANYTDLKNQFFKAVQFDPASLNTPTTWGVGGILALGIAYFVLKGKK